MDGERRISGALALRPRKDVRLPLRFAARAGAVAFLAGAISYAASLGGHLSYPGSPFPRLPGQLAGLVGMAADDVRITGLSLHDPRQVIDAIGVTPGGGLFSFDAQKARAALQALDWVAQADVQRVFPNSIEIRIVEREAFAIWQIDGQYQVIGRDGVPMSGLTPAELAQLPLITGQGANVAASDFINQLSAMPDLMKQVHAAARVGQRRWNLYLDNGVKIALPEQNVEQALEQVVSLDRSQGILSKGIRELDLRQPGQMVVALAEAVNENDTQTAQGRPARQ